jgi:transcriptional regulator with XRE-family HTH domain
VAGDGLGLVRGQALQPLGPGMLRRIRRTADVSQRELAAMLGVAQSTVGRWEAGETSPDLETAARLAGIAGLRLALVDVDDRVVAPMAEDAVRDGGVFRDLLRRYDGTPSDHPLPGTEDETRPVAGAGPD